MMKTSNFFMYTTHETTGGGDITPNDEQNEKSETPVDETKDVKDKSFSEKVHDALQQWSNDDQRDQEIDDRTP